MKLTIDVIQEDIDLGCQRDTNGKAGGCMVYRAFQRCTEGAFPYAQVGYEDILIYSDWDAMQEGYLFSIIQMPGDVGNKIANFDAGNLVPPFSFEVEIPIEA